MFQTVLPALDNEMSFGLRKFIKELGAEYDRHLQVYVRVVFISIL